ncbi:MAG: gamma-glutamylcyclotransferase [Chitinophagaceae bacterium]|nr:gamma-glutamylcyclotransferase [Chitinophagaceae bacterium]
MSHPPMCHRIFVYGSLRKGFNSPAYQYISQYFDFESNGRINGRLYDLGEYPAAVPDTGDAFIIGELYCIRRTEEFEWALAQLDDYEGIHEDEDGPAHYRRELVMVHLPDGSEQQAWVYWYARSVEGKPWLPSGDVLDYRPGTNR